MKKKTKLKIMASIYFTTMGIALASTGYVIYDSTPKTKTAEEILSMADTSDASVRDIINNYGGKLRVKRKATTETLSVVGDYGVRIMNGVLDDCTTVNAGVSDADVWYYRAACNSLPSCIVNLLKSAGFRFILVTGEIDCNDWNHVIGKADYVKREITISVDKHESIPTTLYHEIGHVIAHTDIYDRTMEAAGIDVSDIQYHEYHTIYLHGVDQSLYHYLQPSEIQAELFYEFVFYPDEFEKLAPNLYKTYSLIFASIKKTY